MVLEVFVSGATVAAVAAVVRCVGWECQKPIHLTIAVAAAVVQAVVVTVAGVYAVVYAVVVTGRV